jgi:N-acetylglutamate synthase-like GNAT family acetyltransferase
LLETGCTGYHSQNGSFTVRADRNAIDFDAVYDFLKTTPWASGLSRDALDRAMRNSLCFSLFEEDRQIGFARVITDFATYAYLCDVYVTEARRSQGLGSWLIQCVLAHPEIATLKRIALITHDAQDFYLKLGFQFASKPDRYMERLTQSL